jgi:hypothetical protein
LLDVCKLASANDEGSRRDMDAEHISRKPGGNANHFFRDMFN